MKNEISSLPAEIGRLVNLKELNVDSNHLTSLPNQLCCLGHLQELSASNNNLLTLPQGTGFMFYKEKHKKSLYVAVTLYCDEISLPFNMYTVYRNLNECASLCTNS